MRVSAFGLLALAGCNQIFGLDAVTVVDAAGPPDAPFPRVRLTHQVAGTKLAPPATIADPDPELGYPAIAPPPSVRIGTLTEALVEAAYDADGGVEIALPELFGTKWRLEYTVPGGPPHEVQWTPVMDEAHLVVPVVGRLDRGMAPTDSGYDVQPIGTVPPPPATFIASHVFMTGVFVDIVTLTNPRDAQIDAPSSTFDGALGNPDLARGDYAVLVNYDLVLNGTCGTFASGFAGFQPPPLQSGARTAPSPQPTWRVPNKERVNLTYRNLGPLGLELRLGGALGTKRTGVVASALQHGHLASTLLPGFTHARQDVPSPLLFSLANCQLGITSTTDFIAPTDIAGFPRGTYAMLSSARTTATAKLTSSIATVTVSAPPQADVIDFGVPIASAPIVLDAGGLTFDISTDVDNDDTIRIPAGTGTFELTFALESDQADVALAVDYFETTVFRFEGSTLVPVRVITTTDVTAAAQAPRVITAPILIDRALFARPNRYVIAIRTFRGRPNAARGDFTTVAYPQSVATIFTHTILVE